MVGTGIFTAPGAVLQATQNKTIVLVFWVLGFIYTLLSAVLYLEYSRDLMYNGGELVYMSSTKLRDSTKDISS
ncbi:hypothetical protein BDV97DRAFT_362988 [Delphinella strobiligena]|nr:hypothetical protein BDV97DRAFT_362988 [Delphinella strobiligena]